MNIATRSVEIFTTSDGKDFDDFTGASRHQAVLDADDGITAFIASRGIDSDAAATRARNLLNDYVAFLAGS